MKPPRRWLFNAFAAMSLIVCLAVAAVWVRSYCISDIIVCEEAGDAPFIIHDAYAVQGSLVLVEDFEGVRFVDGVEDEGPPPNTRRWYLKHTNVSVRYHWGTWQIWNALGFHYDEGDAHGVSWTVPLWPMLLLSGILPAVYLGRIMRRRRRIAAGLCIACGYDLRSTPQRCPECGATPIVNG